MSKNKTTKSQAAAMRQIAAGKGLNGIRTSTLMALMNDGRVARKLGSIYIVTDAGREALAAYDAHAFRYGA